MKIPKDNHCLTGVKGLDFILNGGLPLHCFYLIQGAPGVGKTTLALQFLKEGAKNKEKCLYVTLSETQEELETVAQSHDWTLDGFALLDFSAIEQCLDVEKQNTVFHASELELNQIIQLIKDEVERTKPSRVVFDSLSEIRLLAQNHFRYRRQILALKQFFAKRSCTVLLLDDMANQHALDEQVESIAHGVIFLEKLQLNYGTYRRRMHIRKIRGKAFREGNHDYAIKKGGLEVYPRLVANEHRHPFKRESLSTGNTQLDELLGGGIDRGTSSILLGPPGTGKSTLTMLFAYTLAQRKEHAFIYTFDENLDLYCSRAEALGMDFRKYIDLGFIHVRQVDPAEISPGELVQSIRDAVEVHGARLIIIDSLNGYLNAMPEEKYLVLQLHEILTYLNQQGVISILIVTNQGFFGANMPAPVDATYLADTAVILRFFESAGKVKKAISVIKKRSGAVEDTIREFKIEKTGIVIGQPLTQFRGVLTGTPTFVGKTEDILK